MPTFLQNEQMWEGSLIVAGFLAFALAAAVVARCRATFQSEDCGDSTSAVEEEIKPLPEPELRPNKTCFEGNGRLQSHLTRTVRMACADITTSTRKLFKVIAGPKPNEKL